MNLAQEVAKVMQEEYERKKEHPFFTFAGFCYFWNSKERDFAQEPISEYRVLVPAVCLALEKKKALAKPRMYVPKHRDEVAHYSLLCMRNAGRVAGQFAEMAEMPSVEDIVNDKRWLHEAVQAYVTVDVPKEADFTDFLAFYRKKERWSAESMAGDYRFLLERVWVRFEESSNILTSMASLLEGHIVQGWESRNQQALEAKKPRLDAEWLAAYKYWVGEPHEILTEAVPVTPRRVFGKRRVRVGCGSNGYFPDLQDLADRLRAGGRIALDPNQWLREQLINTLLLSQLEAYRKDPVIVKAKVQDHQRGAQNPAEAVAWGVVANRLESLERFDESNDIHHSMKVMSKGDKDGK